MAMTDEERLHQELGLAIFNTAGRFPNERDRMAAVIAQLRAMGHTITARPAPEPTYTITFPSDLYWVARSLVETSTHKSPREGELLDALSDLLANTTPDPELQP